MKELEVKYIQLLLNRCLNFENAKSLMIHLDLKEHIPFALKVKEMAHQMGVFDVCISVGDLDSIHEYLRVTPLEEIDGNSIISRKDWEKYAKKGGALLFLESEVPGLMSDIPEEKIAKWIVKRNETSPYYRANVTKYAFPWCIAALSNERWANDIFPHDRNAYQKLYLKILEMCMVREQNPVLAWQEFIKKSNLYKNKLNEMQITKMHYQNSLGTDLYVEKRPEAKWLNLDKTDANGHQMIANMPSYEIFTSPDYRKTEGIVYSSKPLFYNGNLIDQFWLQFQDGKVIDFDAKVGRDYLASILRDNENACFLGEIALVEYNSPISNTGLVFNTTLFDENASCHFALGDSYKLTISGANTMSDEELDEIGLNHAKIHVDFMIGTSDLEIEAETNMGRKLIFKNGNFVI